MELEAGSAVVGQVRWGKKVAAWSEENPGVNALHVLGGTW